MVDKNIPEGVINDGTGWVPLHRSIQKWEWYTDVNTCHLYNHIKLFANWETKPYRGVMIKRGQYKSSIRDLSQQTGLTISQVRTALNNLTIKTKYIIIEESGNNDTLYSIMNYEEIMNIPKKEIGGGIAHLKHQNNEENTIDYKGEESEHRTPLSTLDRTPLSTLDHTLDHTRIAHESHTISNNIKNLKIEREEEQNSLSEELKLNDLKKINIIGYKQYKNRWTDITDQQINISYGKYCVKYQKKQQRTPATLLDWIENEKPERWIKLSSQPVKSLLIWNAEAESKIEDITFRQLRYKLYNKHGASVFNNWLTHLKLFEHSKESITLCVKNRLFLDHINTFYSRDIEKIIKNLEPTKKVNIIIKKEEIHANTTR